MNCKKCDELEEELKILHFTTDKEIRDRQRQVKNLEDGFSDSDSEVLHLMGELENCEEKRKMLEKEIKLTNEHIKTLEDIM